MENKVEQQKEIKRDSLKKSSIFNITINLFNTFNSFSICI